MNCTISCMRWESLSQQFITFGSCKYKPLSKTILVLLMVCCTTGVKAQPTQEYLFSHFGVKEGLPEEMVTTVQQDAKGYIWVASQNMIQRYDGQRFINFFHKDSDPNSIPAGGITRMQMDKKNRLWILSGMSSFGYLTTDDFVYHPVTVRIPEGDFTKAASGLHIDQEGHVFLIFVGHTFLTYNDATNEVAQKYNPFQLPSGWDPLYIWQDEARNYWIGCHLGLLKYNPAVKTMYYRGHNEESDPIIRHFKDARTVVFAYVDKINRFWLEAWPENRLTIKSYIPATNHETDWQADISKALHGVYFEMNGVTETKDGSVWIAGNNLLARINNGNVEPVFNNGSSEYSIRFDMVFSLYEDREKNIWVSTNKGLYLFNPLAQRFRVVNNRRPGSNTIYTPDVTGFLETSDGEMLVSTWGNGVFAYNKEFMPIHSRYVDLKVMPEGAMIWCMIERNNKDVWFGAQGGSLYIYKAATGKLSSLRPPVFENSTIRQVVADKQDNLWFGTQRGSIIKWNAATDSFEVCQQLKARIARLYIDSTDHIWACTDINGVFRMSNNGKLEATYGVNAATGQKLRLNGAADILQYDDSTFVIASDGLNILNTRTNQFRYLTTEKGLASGHISSLLKDPKGYIWMSSAAGVQSFHPSKQKISYYNAKDGVPNNSFNPGAATILKNGSFIFGTNHDALLFEPARLTLTNYIPPKVEIAGFAVMNIPLSVDSLSRLKQVDLRNFEHSLTIELTTLTYQNTYIIYYKLEGMDKDWLEAGKLNQAIFNYLRPGRYVFKTACKDDKGNMGIITSLIINIEPPFWKTWWFFSLVALLIGGLLFWLDQKRMQRKEAIQKIRSDIAGNLHEEVNMALNNINILSEMARLKADTEPQKSKEFIEQIHAKSNNMIISMNDMLWSISPLNDSMEKTVERMQEYIDELNTKHEAGIEIQVDDNVRSLKLDMQLRHEAFLLFKESIRVLVNAGARKPRIHVALERSNLLYSIQFNNQHCDMQQLNNLLQRQDMGRRLDTIRAKLEVQVHKSNSMFELKVPVG